MPVSEIPALSIKGRTIRKLMGGWGKKTKKKLVQGVLPRKNSCKEGKEKKFMQKFARSGCYGDGPRENGSRKQTGYGIV